MIALRTVVLACLRLLDRIAWRLVDRLDHRASTSDGYVLVLPSAGGGNIGDQAMFESVVANLTDRKVVALVLDRANYDLTFEPDSDRVQTVDVPDLMHGHGLKHIKSLLEVRRLSRGATSFIVIGADILDGAYSTTIASRSWFLCEEVARRGQTVRVLGFSWNGFAPRAVLRAAMKAAAAGAHLFPRDPHSWARLSASKVPNLTSAADTVFCHQARVRTDIADRSSAILAWMRCPDKRAVVNLSGLVASRMDQNPEYLAILDALARRGLTPLLVPHVSHDGASDIEAISSFLDYLREQGHDEPSFVGELLSPTDIRTLVAEADLVITGRMHLSILGILEGATPVVLATQGKVSGLLELFGIEDHCVDPVPGFGAVVAGLVEDMAFNDLGLRLAPRLEEVRKRAELNFA